MNSLSWGVSYNRLNAFDRRFRGYNMPTETSLSNYIASYTQGVNSSEMLFDDDKNYNPFLDSSKRLALDSGLQLDDYQQHRV